MIRSILGFKLPLAIFRLFLFLLCRRVGHWDFGHPFGVILRCTVVLWSVLPYGCFTKEYFPQILLQDPKFVQCFGRRNNFVLVLAKMERCFVRTQQDQMKYYVRSTSTWYGSVIKKYSVLYSLLATELARVL